MYQVIQNQAWFQHSLEEGGGGSRLILTYSSTNDSDIALMFVDYELALILRWFRSSC